MLKASAPLQHHNWWEECKKKENNVFSSGLHSMPPGFEPLPPELIIVFPLVFLQCTACASTLLAPPSPLFSSKNVCTELLLLRSLAAGGKIGVVVVCSYTTGTH